MLDSKKQIRVAIVAPLFMKIPPKKQGGTEWICCHQANELVKRGYNVTLFAVKGSKTLAKLVPIIDTGTRSYQVKPRQMEASRKLRLEMIGLGLTFSKVVRSQFDIIFNHARGGGIITPFTKKLKIPMVTVMHLPIFKELAQLYALHKTSLISISHAQRKRFSRLNYVGNVYNGVDTKTFSLNQTPNNYFLTITTIGEHKNPLASILAVKKTKEKLIIAGKIRDKNYFNYKIKTHIDGKQIKYVGEIGLKEKIKLYQNAKGFLFSSIWPEPFGLVMIESLSCGTPVVAFRNAAVPEIITHKKKLDLLYRETTFKP